MASMPSVNDRSGSMTIVSESPVVRNESRFQRQTCNPRARSLHEKRGGSPPPLSQPFRTDSDLSEPAVDVDFHPGDVGRILRSQKRYSACHLFRLSKTLHWNLRKELLRKFIEGFLWQPGPPKDRRNNWPRRDRVDADAAPRQLRGCCSRQRTQRRFGCRVRAGACSTCLARNAGIQDDRGAVIQQRQRFLDREVRSFDIDIELLVVCAFRRLGKRRKLRNSRVHE